MRKILLTILACAAVCACDKEMKSDSNPVQKTFEGDVAYIVVNINEVNSSSTRATAGTNGDFEYGSSDEYAINDAHFYFYGGTNNEFVAESNAWNNGTANDTIPATNVEWRGNTVLTLHGLTGTSYPNWVVTVLNQPAGFTRPDRLADFEKALAENNDNGFGTPGEYGIYTKGAVEILNDPYGDGSGDYYFTMSTSSYDHGSSSGAQNTFYYATPVTEENFALEDLTLDGDGNYVAGDGENVVPIEIYVERLVAKTRVGLGSTFANSVTGSDGETYYQIEVEEEIDGTVADVDLYVHLEGWELNGVANTTYMVKNIDTSWGSSSPYGWGWNDADNHRSYWAMYPGYNDTSVSWPTTSGGNDYDGAKGMNEYLRWFDLDPEYLHEIADYGATEYDYQYCGENTNTCGTDTEVAVIKSKRSAAITNVLVSATIGEFDEDGAFVPAELVRVNGVLYTKDNYRVYAASHIYLYTRYTSDGSDGYDEGTVVYTQTGPDDLVIVNDTDGYVHIELNPSVFGYPYTDDNGDLVEPDEDERVTIYSDTNGTVITFADANTYIDEYFNRIYGDKANGYTSGMMYYSIPVEHLNDNYTSTYTDSEGNEQILVLEGNYGMVRNHIYSITITGIENIGWGVFNPEEVIIPQEDIDTYSLTANVNILSWKVVEQSTVL